MPQGNPFESGARKVIPAVLVYAQWEGRVLMIHRDSGFAPLSTSGDYHAGKWNGLGGKGELDESPLETARREFHEEAGVSLPLESFKPLGTLTFPCFKSHKNEDWFVSVFVADLSAQDARQVVVRSLEGQLHWVPLADLLKLNLWPGDRHFIPYVVDRRPFMGTIWYRGAEVVRHWVCGI